jgi:prefoldin subunit 5
MIELAKISGPIIISIITVFGGALIKFYLDNKSLKQNNNNLKEVIKDMSLSIQLDLQTFNDIKEIVETILQKTKADRFVILSATNGKFDLRFATAIYEHHKNSDKVILSIGATGKYVKFEFDSAYKKMLKDTEQFGVTKHETKLMIDCDLKNIYENEAVNFSNVYFVKRAKIDENNDRVFYCSVATHSDSAYTRNENSVFKYNIDKLKLKFENL